ncbi:MAG: hypothetical protein V2I74_12530 [Erythrobacter sp.]|jgi:hypothetical protein|nr:hypothetical protein [Erythrobacter sp.]
MAGRAIGGLTLAALFACAGCGTDPAEPVMPETGAQTSTQPQLAIAPWPPVYVCKFRTYGTIIIEADPRDTRIVINGVSMPAQREGGVFRSLVGSEMVTVGPGDAYWEYKGERSEDCTPG